MSSPARPPDRFVARDDALAELVGAFAAGSRWVVILGPGGIGKTRLAMEHLSREEGRRPPAVFVDAAPLDSIEELRGAILSELGAISLDDDEEGVARALAERIPLRLVVDNVEQIAEGVAVSVPHWLEAAGGLQVLMTSRVAPPARGVHLLRLAGLDATSAAELFLLRAREHGLDVSAGPDVERIVARLDGIPLAIELAAARTDVLGPRELAERLETSVSILEDARSDRPDRHTSLQTVFDGSVRALSEDHRSALEQCAVFAGPFDLAAAEDVIDIRGEVLDALGVLGAHSLLQRRPVEHGPVLRLLEPLRQLLPPPNIELRRRHARHFVARGARLSTGADGLDAMTALDELVAIREDLVAAVAHCWADDAPDDAVRGAMALGVVDTSRRSSTSAAHQFDVPARALGAVEPSLRVRFLVESALARCRIGDLEHSASEVDRLESIDPDLLGPERRAEIRWVRGVVEVLTGRFDAAAEHLQAALDLQRSVGDRAGEAMTLAFLGRMSRARFALDDAERQFRQAIEIQHARGATRHELQVVLGLANTFADGGRLEEAGERYARVVAMAEALGDEPARGCVHGNLAMLAHERGDADQAFQHYEIALDVLRGLGDRVLLPYVMSSCAMLHRLQGRVEEAQETAIEARRLALERSADWATLPLAIEGAMRGAAGAAELGAERLAEAERLADRRDDAHLRQTVSILRAVFCIETDAPGAFEDAHAAVWEATHGPRRNFPHRLAVALLMDRVDDRGWREPCSTAPQNALLVREDAASFRLPDGSAGEALPQDSPARRLLLALARERRRRPGAALTAAELIERVWPDERIVEKAAKNRLHVALSKLRKAGLGDLLERTDDGYRLATEVALLFGEP